MLIKSFLNEEENEMFPIIEGECVSCGSENSLVIKSNKILSSKTAKINFTCIVCRNNFNYILKDE